MRHRLSGRKLNRTSQHRRAMFANMAASLIKHEQIKTKLPKAKELRSIVDRLITLGKTGRLHDRRRAYAFLRDDPTTANHIETMAPSYRPEETRVGKGCVSTERLWEVREC